jgi:hypothetical protein
MNRPDQIDKRVYVCKQCKYSAQVYGEMYFDSGCHNYMATFECPECKVLFEGLISQIQMDELEFEAHHNLADVFECLRCGNKKAKVWNKDTGKCPKCEGEFEYEVIGKVKLKWK